MALSLNRTYTGLGKRSFDRSGSERIELVKPSMANKVTLIKPSWNKTHTVVRPLPQPDPKDPTRWGDFKVLVDGDEYNVGPWLRTLEIADYVGPNGLTFVTHDPRGGRSPYLDRNDVPYRMVCRTAADGHKNGNAKPSWAEYDPYGKEEDLKAKGLKNRLKRPDELCFMQCLVYMSKDVTHDPPIGANGIPALIRFTMKAAEKLVGYVIDGNPMYNIVCPDLVAFEAGGFIDFTQIGTPTRSNPYPILTSYQPSVNAFGYDVSIYPSFNGKSPALSGDLAATAAAGIVKWDDLFEVPGPEEQVHKIAASGIPASLIVQALDEKYGKYIPEQTRKDGKAELGWGTPVTSPGVPNIGGGVPRPPVPSGNPPLPGGHNPPPPPPPSAPAPGYLPPPPAGGLDAPPFTPNTTASAPAGPTNAAGEESEEARHERLLKAARERYGSPQG